MFMSFSQSRHGARRRQFDTALIVLGRAADREDQLVLPMPISAKAHGIALDRILKSLLDQELVEEIPVGPHKEAWRSDGEDRLGLRITAAGLKAIGVPALVSGVGGKRVNDAYR